jgi:hypothetical protein
VRVEAFIKVKEIPNSGGKVTASFTNELSYGYGGSDSWENHTACSWQMVPNGVYR